MGASFKIKNGYVHGSVKSKLKGTSINFKKKSVGATENLIMAATLAEGQTIIYNAAQEPEINDLCNFLIQIGAKIKGHGTEVITIDGVKKLNGGEFEVMPDRIEAGTYLLAGAVTEGNLKVQNIVPKVIKTEIDILKKIGSKIIVKRNEVQIIGNKKINGMKIKTAPYPGFPTDLQAQIMVLLCKAKKNSIIKENIFENRFMHVAELNRMGAKISIDGNKAIIKGNINFASAELMATDLRASVSLILAALTARGKSVINRIYHLDSCLLYTSPSPRDS